MKCVLHRGTAAAIVSCVANNGCERLVNDRHVDSYRKSLRCRGFSLVPKEKRSAQVALLSFGSRAPRSVTCTWKRCTSCAVAVAGRAIQSFGPNDWQAQGLVD